jgi:RimJ/RimL family protein N-acetyltransferase
VTISVAAMTPEWADDVALWRYEAPFEVYNGDDASPLALLDGNHLAILDDGAFVGYVGIGPECRVPGGPDDDGAVDIGIGIRPDRLSERLGTRAGELLLETMRVGGVRRLRVSVLSSNERSIRLALRLGFLQASTFEDARDGRTFVVLERELLD